MKNRNGRAIENFDPNVLKNPRKIGKDNGIEVVCILTNMNVPLGNNIGNALEVEETIAILKDHKMGHLRDLCVELSSHMVSLGLNISYEKAKEQVLNNLENGNAYEQFKKLITAQHGNLDKLPKCMSKYEDPASFY